MQLPAIIHLHGILFCFLLVLRLSMKVAWTHKQSGQPFHAVNILEGASAKQSKLATVEFERCFLTLQKMLTRHALAEQGRMLQAQ